MCVEQPRSVDTVGAADSHSPEVQGVTAKQAAPSLAPDHVEPATHGSHVRSVADVPAVFWPWPAAHVRHAVQAFAPPLPAAENVPPAHAVHDALCAAAQYPASHCVQLPAPALADQPAPHGVIDALPSQEWPDGHGPHVRSDDTVGAAVSRSDDEHVRTDRQIALP